MTRFVFFGAVMTVIVLGTASAFKLDVPEMPTAPPPPATTCADEIGLHADTPSLPDCEIHDPFWLGDASTDLRAFSYTQPRAVGRIRA